MAGMGGGKANAPGATQKGQRDAGKGSASNPLGV